MESNVIINNLNSMIAELKSAHENAKAKELAAKAEVETTAAVLRQFGLLSEAETAKKRGSRSEIANMKSGVKKVHNKAVADGKARADAKLAAEASAARNAKKYNMPQIPPEIQKYIAELDASYPA